MSTQKKLQPPIEVWGINQTRSQEETAAPQRYPRSTASSGQQSRLEQQFQRKLPDPGISGTLNIPEVSGVGSRGRVVQVGVVKHVEKFSVELQPEAIARAERKVFERTDVPTDESRAVERSLACVAVGAEREARVGINGNERRRVQIVDASRRNLGARRPTINIARRLHRPVGA